MKKISSAVLAVLLCFCLSFGAFAADAQLSTVVPSTHEITITYNEGGYILYQDTILASESSVTVERFDDVILSIICKPDSHLKSVTVNGEDVTDDVLHGRLSLLNVYTDMDVVFTFEKCGDVPPVDPDDPKYDPENPDKPGDDCDHVAMRGGVYKEDEPFPGATLEIDFGEIEATADDEGKYKIDEIKDGFHTVTINNPDGTPAGVADFVVEVSETATEVTVEMLPDGTQVITVPEGTTEVILDFIVHGDGGLDTDGDGKPDGWTEITVGKDDPEPQPKPEEPSEPDDKKPDNPILDNPIISQTGALIRENPLEASILFAFGFFLLLFVIVRRRRNDEEEETA